jgi:iron complex outermembrane recepter protein
MKNIVQIALLLTLFPSITNAQTTAKISGTVVDDNKKALPFANVSLLKAKDSSLVRSALTDSLGQFEFDKLKKNNYLISASFVGFKPFFSASTAVDSQNIALSSVNMTPLSNLKEVTITSKKPFIERKIDRVVVNPDALISNAGTTAFEVLEKSPGVFVDLKNGINLRGKSKVAIFVDDKPSYLTADNLANFLRGIPSSNIDVVEIMTNPPAKYDAGGGGGVINIRLKKNTAKGFNGTVLIALAQGTYGRTNDVFSFNYRLNKINLFSTISYNFNLVNQFLTIQRNYFQQDGTLKSGFIQNSTIHKARDLFNLKVGMDYYMSKKTTIGFVLSSFYSDQLTTTPNFSTIKNPLGTADSTIQSYSKLDDMWANASLNVNYTYKIGKTQGEISANADYIFYDLQTKSSLQNSIYLPSGALKNQDEIVGNLPGSFEIKAAKFDYSKPLKTGGTFEAGLKTSITKTNNVAKWANKIDKIEVPNYDLTNSFLYEENINAAYVNVNKSFKTGIKKWAVQAGLRYENTITSGLQSGNPTKRDSSFKNDYNRLFPTIYVSYKMDTSDKHLLVFSAGKRIERPSYQSLNPFVLPLDKFTSFSGNPFLKPAFTYTAELAHTYKNVFTTTLSYSYEVDNITDVVENKTVFFTRVGNVGTKIIKGISFDATLTPSKKWWTIQAHSDILNVKSSGPIFDQYLNSEGTNWTISGTNLFKINKLWNAELGGFYNSSSTFAQYVLVPTWSVRAGIQTKILKDKATLKFVLNDIFYRLRPGGVITALSNSTARYDSRADSRYAVLTFTYRFSQGQNLKIRPSGGAETEQKRVKVN